MSVGVTTYQVTKGRRFYNFLQERDVTLATQREFARFSTDRRLWELYSALGGTQSYWFFDRQPEEARLYSIYLLVDETPISKREFYEFESDVHWFLIFGLDGLISLERFLSLTRARRISFLMGVGVTVVSGDWLLLTGFWNDNGIWSDSAIWN